MELVLNTALKAVAVKGGAQIFSGRNIIPSLPATVAEILEGGFVQICFEDAATKFAERYTRLVIGVGGCAAATAAKKIAAELGVECVLVIAYPDGNSFLQGGGVTQVYLDEDILDNCSDDRLAAGWGFAFSEPLKRFEDGFREKVMAERLPRRPALSLPPADAGALGLALCLLDCGAGMREDVFLSLPKNAVKSRDCSGNISSRRRARSTCFIPLFCRLWQSTLCRLPIATPFWTR